MAKVITMNYECRLCGTRVVVSALGEPRLEPIYCCGMEVHEAEVPGAPAKKPVKKLAGAKKPAKKPAKKAVKKTAKKTPKKIAVKKTAKKTSKKK